MASGIDPKVDYVFKRLCGSEDNTPLGVDLVNTVISPPPGRRVRGLHILNPFVEKDYAEGKVSILDVWARDDPGRQFLLEMQQYVPAAFPTRLLYYWSCGHSEQMKEGQRYELLQPTYTICFLNQNLFEDVFYHHTFRVYDAQHGVLLCRDLEMHILELRKFDLPAEQVTTQLERWVYFFKHGATLDPTSLPPTLNHPPIPQAVEVLMRISQDELERHRALERQRAQRDAFSLAETARVRQEELEAAQEKLEAAQKAFEAAQKASEAAQKASEAAQKASEAAQEAAGAARRKGPIIGRIGLLQQLLQQPETPTDELYRLPEADLLRMEQSLKQQLDARKEANDSRSADQT
jgi:predicted transposase/invertase (TIGR01784 family)